MAWKWRMCSAPVADFGDVTLGAEASGGDIWKKMKTGAGGAWGEDEMSGEKTILVAGTWDTKDDELSYLSDVIRGQGGQVLSMDVSVLGDPKLPTDVSKHEVAEAAGLVLGARVPVILNSRADDDMSRLASCAVAALHHARMTGGHIPS